MDKQSSAWKFSGRSGPISGYSFVPNIYRRLTEGIIMDHSSKEQEDAYNELHTLLIDFMSNDEHVSGILQQPVSCTLKEEVNSLYRRYCASNHDDFDCVTEMEIHRQMHLTGMEPDNIERLRNARRQLKYRFEMMDRGQAYVDVLDIGRPNGQSIYETNIQNMSYEMARFREGETTQYHLSAGREKYDKIWTWAAESTCFSKLFPDYSVRRPFEFYDKGWDYLLAAIWYTDRSSSEWKKRIKTLAMEVEDHLQELTDKLRLEPMIEAKLAQLCKATSTRHWMLKDSIISSTSQTLFEI